jgi:hypothetical protein
MALCYNGVGKGKVINNNAVIEYFEEDQAVILPGEEQETADCAETDFTINFKRMSLDYCR